MGGSTDGRANEHGWQHAVGAGGGHGTYMVGLLDRVSQDIAAFMLGS